MRRYTYLLTWNPHQHPTVRDLRKSRPDSRLAWSCANTRSIPVGSRVFLLRQGVEPKGIVASGYTISAVYQDEHWDSTKARSGKKADDVDIQFDVIRTDIPLPREDLNRGALKGVYWDTPRSGIKIPPKAAQDLERLWRGSGDHRRAAAEPTAFEGILTEAKRYTRKRDRKLRELALEQAKGICEACEQDYGALLGGLGLRVLQVHHRQQLRAMDAPRITSLKDLAVVCVNCHALIHADPKRAMPVQYLRCRLGRAGVKSR
jgi:5-methylcytosine-specific restriction protein A